MQRLVELGNFDADSDVIVAEGLLVKRQPWLRVTSHENRKSSRFPYVDGLPFETRFSQLDTLA